MPAMAALKSSINCCFNVRGGFDTPPPMLQELAYASRSVVVVGKNHLIGARPGHRILSWPRTSPGSSSLIASGSMDSSSSSEDFASFLAGSDEGEGTFSSCVVFGL